MNTPKLFEFPSGATLDLNQVYLISAVQRCFNPSRFTVDIHFIGQEPQIFSLVNFDGNKASAEAAAVKEAVDIRARLIQRWSA